MIPLLATIPHPDPMPLPAPHALTWFLLLLTFFLHLLPMNFVLGGSVLSVLLAGGEGEHRPRLRGFLAKALPPMIAAAITLGVAPLLLTQVLYGRLFFASSVVMAWPWASVIVLLLVAYYAAYLVSFKNERLGGARLPVIVLMALSFLMIAFIYTNNMTLMLDPERFAAMYAADPSGWNLNLADASLFPRALHMILGAIAVTGLVLAVYGCRMLGSDAEFGRYAIRFGGGWFVGATAANVGLGLWWLIALPREVMLRFMGGSPLASAALILGILLGLGALIMVLLAIRSETPVALIRGGVVSLVLTLVAMVIARDEVRQGYLAEAGFEPVRWIEPQWGPLALFLVLLVAAIATVVWMVTALARAGRPG